MKNWQNKLEVTGLSMMPRANKSRVAEKEKMKIHIKIKTEMVIPTPVGELWNRSTRRKWMKCMCLCVNVYMFLISG